MPSFFHFQCLIVFPFTDLDLQSKVRGRVNKKRKDKNKLLAMEQIPELCNEWHHTMREYKKNGKYYGGRMVFFCCATKSNSNFS